MKIPFECTDAPLMSNSSTPQLQLTPTGSNSGRLLFQRQSSSSSLAKPQRESVYVLLKMKELNDEKVHFNMNELYCCNVLCIFQL